MKNMLSVSYMCIYGIYIEVKLFEEMMGSNARGRVKKRVKQRGEYEKRTMIPQ